MANKKKITIACIIGVVLIISGVSIYGAIKGKEEVEQVVEVDNYTIPTVENIFVNGTVAPKEVESFGTNLSLGNVETIHVKDGDKVSVGDPVVTYKRDGVDDQIEALQSQLDAVKKAKGESEQAPSRQGELRGQLQEKQLEGLQGLEGLEGIDLDSLDMGGAGTSSMDYDSQISSLETQISKLREMERSVERSGIDGIAYIENTAVQEGITVERVIVRSEEFVGLGSVSEKNILKLSEGMSAQITLLADDREISGEIERIAQRPGSANDMGALDINSAIGGSSSSASNLSNYEVIFKLDTQVDLLEGFSIQARVPLGDDSIVIPESAIEVEGEEKYVYKVVDGIAERVKVEAILSQSKEDKGEDENAEQTDDQEDKELEGPVVEEGKALVKSGLRQGDVVVVSDISKLSGGERVE